MLRRIVGSVVAALVLAALVSAAAITPLDHPAVGAVAKAVCYLDWPVSKATGWMGMSWWGLALFVDQGGGCRGISPDLLWMFGLQALWSVVVYAPIFLLTTSAVQSAIRRYKAR